MLRDASDAPLDGAYDMVFRFFDDADPAPPENEFFVDEHLAVGTGAVTVAGGLFSVALGSGNAHDGSGPGDNPQLYYVFARYEHVWLEVRVGIHSGEVERYPGSVEGVAIHMTARIMSLAGAGEVWLSASTVSLLEGSGLTFSDAGEHVLKGFDGPRRLYRLIND